MALGRIRRPGLPAGCVTCGSAELGPRGRRGGRAGRGCAVRVAPGFRRRHVAPLCRRGQVRAAPRKARGWAEPRTGRRRPRRTALALRRRAGDGRAGAREGGGRRVAFSPSVPAPRHFARTEVALLPAAPPGQCRPCWGLLVGVLERFQHLPTPAADELWWPGTALPDPLVFAGRGRRTRLLFGVPGALLAVCPWLMSRSPALRRRASELSVLPARRFSSPRGP